MNKETVKLESGKILTAFSGVATTWALDLALRFGMVAKIGDSSEGISSDGVAKSLETDPLYTKVVLRSLYAASVIDKTGDNYTITPEMREILLNEDFGGYLGGHAKIFTAIRESYLDYRDLLKSGRREWWSDMSPEWIEAVASACQTYYSRMLTTVFPEIPQVRESLEKGAKYLDVACGSCRGVAKVVKSFPNTKVTAVDGDAYSIKKAKEELKTLGIDSQFNFVEAKLEEMQVDQDHDLAIINVSLHEAPDQQKVVNNVYKSLKIGGTFLVNEFPFPDKEENCRTLPGQLMCGIQAFEAHIGCQLMPPAHFEGLLTTAGFKNVRTIEINPTHVVICGEK